MRLSTLKRYSTVWITVGVALITLTIVGVIGVMALNPPGDLIQNAEFSLDTISPNADGQDDITVFSYELSRNARITLSLVDENGQIFIFRQNENRVSGNYRVNFSGVVDGFVIPQDSQIALDGLWLTSNPQSNVIERRLLPNGVYTWQFTAVDDEGESQTVTGTLTITDADTQLPLIQSFQVSSPIFSPNQDGVRDRIRINVYLVKPAQLTVFLEDQAGTRRYLSERLLGRDEGDEGNHEYDYDGDVDNGFEPPPTGVYTLYAVAQDDEGQRVVRTTTVAIEFAVAGVEVGLPRVEIAPQPTGATVCFSVVPWDDRYYTDTEQIGDLIAKPEGSCSDNSTLTMRQGDLLVFHLSIYNYGSTPIRTFGPWPGTVYEFNQLSNTLGYLETDGVFRIGIHCNTAAIDHPWRWAIAPPAELTSIEDQELNDTFYYLLPEQRSEVWGAIRVTEVFEERNPMICSASLIHEGVNIDPFQQGIGRREIRIVPTSQEDLLSN